MSRILLLITLLSLSSGCGPSDSPKPAVTVSASVHNARAAPMSFWIDLARVEDGRWTSVAHSEHPPVAPGDAVPFSPVKVEGGAELYLSLRARDGGVFFDQTALHIEAGASGALRAVFQITDDGLSARWE